MGSPLYMSPEQIMSPTTVDVRSDIWCLGVVLYELFAHKVPFEADGMPQLVFQVVQQPHASLRTLRPDVPEGLSAAVDRCLSKKQEDRFQNVAELARALAPFGPARSDQSIERIEHVLGMAAAEPQQTGPGPILPRRQGGMTFVPTTSQATTIRGRQYVLPVVLGSLLVLGVGGFFLVRAAAHPGGDRAVAAPAVPAATTAAPPPSAEPPPEVLAPPPSASAPAVATAAPSSSVPWWYGKQAAPAPRGSSSAHPAASSPAAAPTCHVVSFFDADGNKHFKQECP
ncbi:MAG TPA: protein kinase, partial [Polyangiaceae bacterium]